MAKEKDEEAEPFEGGAKEEEKEKEEARRRGGHIKRRRGGKVPGIGAMHRPDRPRRARGGALADANPYTTAGKMSRMDYEGGGPPEVRARAKGPDRE